MNDAPNPNGEHQPTASKTTAVRVLLFGALRDELGAAAVTVRLSLPATGAQFLEHLAGEHPAIAKWQGSLRLAVDQQYATPDTLLAGGEEVALIPPVSGG